MCGGIAKLRPPWTFTQFLEPMFESQVRAANLYEFFSSQGEKPPGHTTQGHDGVLLPGGDPQIPLFALCWQTWGNQILQMIVVAWDLDDSLKSKPWNIILTYLVLFPGGSGQVGVQHWGSSSPGALPLGSSQMPAKPPQEEKSVDVDDAKICCDADHSCSGYSSSLKIYSHSVITGSLEISQACDRRILEVSGFTILHTT